MADTAVPNAPTTNETTEPHLIPKPEFDFKSAAPEAIEGRKAEMVAAIEALTNGERKLPSAEIIGRVTRQLEDERPDLLIRRGEVRAYVRSMRHLALVRVIASAAIASIPCKKADVVNVVRKRLEGIYPGLAIEPAEVTDALRDCLQAAIVEVQGGFLKPDARCRQYAA